MCQALMEIMEPQLMLREKAGLQKGLQQGIRGTVETLRKFGYGDSAIKKAIMEEYELSAEEAENYF